MTTAKESIGQKNNTESVFESVRPPKGQAVRPRWHYPRCSVISGPRMTLDQPSSDSHFVYSRRRKIWVEHRRGRLPKWTGRDAHSAKRGKKQKDATKECSRKRGNGLQVRDLFEKQAPQQRDAAMAHVHPFPGCCLSSRIRY